MTLVAQKRLAVAGALAVVAVFVGANAHLIATAFASHPACATITADRAPARDAC
ncbi:MAG: hypothetical protein IT542_03415 [Rubellimicrobium sp.]|nr:hypothetical protein [Rubellimicrobium sp.]